MRVARIDGGGVTAAFQEQPTGAPTLAYVGSSLPPDQDLAALCASSSAGKLPSSPDRPIPASLLPEGHFGFPGEPALAITRSGTALTTWLESTSWHADAARFGCTLADPQAGVKVQIEWRIGDEGMIRSRAAIANIGGNSFELCWLAALAMPLPAWAERAIRFPGRWSDEFQTNDAPLAFGLHEVRSRGGRPGFDNPGWLLLAEAATGDDHGPALGLHLAWSGDARCFTERTGVGLRQLQMGCSLAPGEVRLAPGERFETPEALLAFSDGGLRGMSARFHAYVRASLPAWPVRKVHFNSWEAAYFDYDEGSLTAMAEAAAALGCERFVLDDGWFEGRRDDGRALGDWMVDRARFPDGLAPLIARVHALGMDFGLWIEPEMVSPDSALYRSRPEWCLHLEGRPRPTQRRQLVLDLTRAEVRDHLFAAIDSLLREHAIAYLKWDHNRDLFPAFSGSRPCGHAQVLGLYALVDRVRAAHPHVEIEACASGGARTDLALLSRTGRLWLSDSTDPAKREAMQRIAGLFLPPEVMGSHVGAIGSHDMAYRARVAMRGHMGVELDPRKLNAGDAAVLAEHIARYKQLRGG